MPERVGIYFSGRDFRVVVADVTNGHVSIIDRKTWVVEKASEIAEALGDMLERATVVTSIPPDRCIVKNLNIPIQNKKKVSKVIPGELSDQVVMDVEELWTAHMFQKSPGYVLTVSTRKDYIEDFVKNLDESHLMVDVVTDGLTSLKNLVSEPNAAIVLVERDFSAIVFVNNGDILTRVVKYGSDYTEKNGGSWFPVELRKTMIAHRVSMNEVEKVYVCGLRGADVFKKYAQEIGINLRDIQVPENVDWPFEKGEFISYAPAVALVHGGWGINFRTGPFAPSFTKGLPVGLFKKVSATFLVFSAVINVGLGVKKSTYKEIVQNLKTRQLNIFMETFPGQKKILDPYLQMKDMVKRFAGKSKGEGSAPTSFLDTLYHVARGSSATGVKLTQFSFVEGKVEIDGECKDVELIDTFRKRLQDDEGLQKVKVVLTRRSKTGDSFKFRIRAEQ